MPQVAGHEAVSTGPVDAAVLQVHEDAETGSRLLVPMVSAGDVRGARGCFDLQTVSAIVRFLGQPLLVDVVVLSLLAFVFDLLVRGSDASCALLLAPGGDAWLLLVAVVLLPRLLLGL